MRRALECLCGFMRVFISILKHEADNVLGVAGARS